MSRGSHKPTSIARQGRGRTAAARYLRTSDGDHAARLYNKSLAHLYNDHAKQDDALAFELNERAAYLGDRDAILAMGWFYNHGVGVERDDERAKKWYRESARLGEPMAMFSLGGIAYEHHDYDEARVWLERAIDLDHVRALFWLGKLYWRGAGVPEDRARALSLFEEAAAKRCVEARRFRSLTAALRKAAKRKR